MIQGVFQMKILFILFFTSIYRFVPVFESETLKKGAKGTYDFKSIEILATTLIRDDLNRSIKIEMFEW